LRRITLCLLFFEVFSLAYSNESKLDSLLVLKNKESIREDSKLLFDIFYEISFSSKYPEQKGLYADSAFIVANLNGSIIDQAAARVLKSTQYLWEKDLAKALKVLQEADQLYSKAEMLEGRGMVAYRLGDIYLKVRDYPNSEKWFKESIILLDSCKDTIRLGASFSNFGELYRVWGKPQEAIRKFEQSEFLFQEIEYLQGVAYAKGNRGLVYIDLEEYDSAKVNINQALKVLVELDDSYSIASFEEGLARIHFAEGHYFKAIQSAQKSFKLAHAHGLKEQMRDASLTLANIYNVQKKYDKAYQKHCEYVVYRDSINNEETVRKIADLRTKYEVAQKQKEVDDLVNQKERYTIIGISLFVVLALLLAHVAHLYRNRRLRKHDAIILAKQHKELEIANDTKNKFFSILSHDLRSPIATFNSYSEVLNYYLETNDYEQIPQLAKELERSSASVVQLLDNLLQWGVIQMKNIKINKVNVPILQVFQEELIHIQPIANSKDIQIQSNIASDLELHVDKPFFAMTMRNLISNSLKFTKVGGFITVSAYREKDHIIVKVADTGIGLEVADFKKRLCSGDIASTYGTNNEKGLGLGLQLVCSFMESHGAEIDVESIIGKGTTFILKFKNTILS